MPARRSRRSACRDPLAAAASGSPGPHQGEQRWAVTWLGQEDSAKPGWRPGHRASTPVRSESPGVAEPPGRRTAIPAPRGTDNRHSAAGADWLAQWFGDEVTEPVRLHVAAKRYL